MFKFAEKFQQKKKKIVRAAVLHFIKLSLLSLNKFSINSMSTNEIKFIIHNQPYIVCGIAV